MALPDQDKLKEIKSKVPPATEDLKRGPKGKVIPPAASTQAQEQPKTEEKQNPEITATVTDIKETPVFNPDELTEDQILAAAEKKGFKIQKDALTPEQQQKADQIEKIEKLRYGVENGLITEERYRELESVISADPAELTKKEFTKSYKKDNPNATAAETEDAYDDYYAIQRNVKVKEYNRKKDLNGDLLDEYEENEVEKPKFGERLVKWGEQRRLTKAERIKADAKAVLENLDSNYTTYKQNVAKANDYASTVDKAMKETDFSKFPVQYKIKNKEITATVDLGKEVPKEIQKYLTTPQIAGLIITNDKQKDTTEIQKLVRGYVKDRYSDKISEALWDLAKTEGINEGKVGSSAPLEKLNVSNDPITKAEEQLKTIRPEGIEGLKKDKPTAFKR